MPKPTAKPTDTRGFPFGRLQASFSWSGEGHAATPPSPPAGPKPAGPPSLAGRGRLARISHELARPRTTARAHCAFASVENTASSPSPTETHGQRLPVARAERKRRLGCGMTPGCHRARGNPIGSLTPAVDPAQRSKGSPPKNAQGHRWRRPARRRARALARAALPGCAYRTCVSSR